MRLFLLASFTLLLASRPLASLAQTPRFYVGAGVSVQTTAPFQKPDDFTNPTLVGPALLVGTRFTPHLGIQVGGSYAERNSSSTSTGTQAGYPYSAATTVRARAVAIPLLLRYTFTRPASRLHVEALGGGTVVHSTAHGETQATILTPGAPRVATTAADAKRTTASLALGPALRYSLLSHLDIAADAPVNMILGGSTSRFADRLFWGLRGSLQYTFGQ